MAALALRDADVAWALGGLLTPMWRTHVGCAVGLFSVPPSPRSRTAADGRLASVATVEDQLMVIRPRAARAAVAVNGMVARIIGSRVNSVCVEWSPVWPVPVPVRGMRLPPSVLVFRVPVARS